MAVPQDVEMEENVIASMLLSTAAAETAMDLLTAADFHVPMHAKAFGSVERQLLAGGPVDDNLVALDCGLPASKIRELKYSATASMSVRPYCGIVLEKAGLRRAILLADRLRDAAYAQDSETVDALLLNPMDSVLPEHDGGDDPIPAAELAAEDYKPEFVVPNVIARQEIAMFVGEPGHGKSTLLRQFGVCAASGLHPFSRVRIPPMRVLLVDCQESRGAAGVEIRRMLEHAGDRFTGGLWVQPKPSGIDLTVARWQRWLDRQVARVDADLVILGPLYNMMRGGPNRGKQSEETAELAAACLGDLMVRRNVALMIEAHAPHGDDMRVRGSKMWEDWPHFGFGLVPEKVTTPGRAPMEVRRFRGDRHTGRSWPKRYVPSSVPNSWPWEAA